MSKSSGFIEHNVGVKLILWIVKTVYSCGCKCIYCCEINKVIGR